MRPRCDRRRRSAGAHPRAGPRHNHGRRPCHRLHIRRAAARRAPAGPRHRCRFRPRRRTGRACRNVDPRRKVLAARARHASLRTGHARVCHCGFVRLARPWCGSVRRNGPVHRHGPPARNIPVGRGPRGTARLAGCEGGRRGHAGGISAGRGRQRRQRQRHGRNRRRPSGRPRIHSRRHRIVRSAPAPRIGIGRTGRQCPVHVHGRHGARVVRIRARPRARLRAPRRAVVRRLCRPHTGRGRLVPVHRPTNVAARRVRRRRSVRRGWGARRRRGHDHGRHPARQRRCGRRARGERNCTRPLGPILMHHHIRAHRARHRPCAVGRRGRRGRGGPARAGKRVLRRHHTCGARPGHARHRRTSRNPDRIERARGLGRECGRLWHTGRRSPARAVPYGHGGPRRQGRDARRRQPRAAPDHTRRILFYRVVPRTERRPVRRRIRPARSGQHRPAGRGPCRGGPRRLPVVREAPRVARVRHVHGRRAGRRRGRVRRHRCRLVGSRRRRGDRDGRQRVWRGLRHRYRRVRDAGGAIRAVAARVARPCRARCGCRRSCRPRT